MGGVQSGAHALGDALWVQERQKQKGYRDSNIRVYDTGSLTNGSSSHPPPTTSTQDRRKLLKRTRSLAVISEDECRAAVAASTAGIDAGEEQILRASYDSLSLQHRRQQLIPRAKLIDRNALKDRLSKSQQQLSDWYETPASHSRVCQSHSVCGIYNSLPAPQHKHHHQHHQQIQQQRRALQRPVTSVEKPERLNIFEWPDSPRRYRSVQDLNSVSGLVDIVEDNCWPLIEENRSIDCIYTQIKRKRKEHRSLDSILFEDDSDELEYFDVLNLLPLSNVRLEIDESDKTNSNPSRARKIQQSPDKIVKSNPNTISAPAKTHYGSVKQCDSHRSIARHTKGQQEALAIDKVDGRKPEKSKDIEKLTSFPELAKGKNHTEKANHNLERARAPDVSQTPNKFSGERYLKLEEAFSEGVRQITFDKQKEGQPNSDAKSNRSSGRQVEETEDTKSLWISDNEDTEEMSRRPQVLKVIDSDVTKSNPMKNSCTSNDKSINKEGFNEHENNEVVPRYETIRISTKPDLINDHIYEECEGQSEQQKVSVENARNFFEKKNIEKESTPTPDDEGRIGRIVRETSSILGKACNAVKGSLGFESRSESSDLGIGSEIGSEVRRLSMDGSTNTADERKCVRIQSKERDENAEDSDEKNSKNGSNLTRSRSCIDSIECQDSDELEFDRVRYKIVKSNMFGKNIINGSKKDVTYEGLMQYLREYSFQDLIMDNNVVIIEPVRAEVDRKPSFNDGKVKTTLKNQTSFRIMNSKTDAAKDSDEKSGEESKNHFKKPRQSSLRKHFFYQPIRVNRELNDDELPDPDTVRNVRKIFEESLKNKLNFKRDCSTRRSVSMKDLRSIENQSFESSPEKTTTQSSRSRCSSRAKDLTRMFENMEKASSNRSCVSEGKDETDALLRSESKARTIAQSFEVRSEQSSPSNSNSSKIRNNRYQQQRHTWESGSVSSGVSSDYPDTDAGSAPACTSSEDEDLYCHDDDGVDERYEGHYVSQDVLKKIRECGTSVTYYGGKVVNTCNGPLICPMVCKKSKKKTLDYIKFRLVKSNSCDSRLELTGRTVIGKLKQRQAVDEVSDKCTNLTQFTIDETPSIEITQIDQTGVEDQGSTELKQVGDEKRDLPVVIGLEPKKEENKGLKVNFKLGKIEDCNTIDRFAPRGLARWQINENNWKRQCDFGKMEFEEFEVLEDSLNEVNN